MSLPPGFLDELRSRLSMAQVAGRKVTWDSRKSNRGKGDLWAPCPFHQEKTASFHVDDRKGFYYCFGCHAKGDAISFVRETENAGFMEAVEILAREAGMTMPERDPRAQERADRRTTLAEVMEEAVRWLRLQLRTGAGAAARDYLSRRGLGEAQIERWQIGFAPDLRDGLFRHLTGKGIAAEAVVEAGLCARPDDGGGPFDRFRGRIIFPIRDVRGRAIALGGRAMDPAARSKYLNSPETPLFDKGRSLYNAGPAREAAGKGQPLIVAEGYMDTIALSEAGFGATVAPLGTAITETQLQLLWRIHPEPVIALDGDTAGRRAAMRLVDLALPMLEAGRSLRFAMLPEGQDPDDLLRSGGRAAMEAALERAVPLVQMLWERELAAAPVTTPEAKAGLDKRLGDAIRTIRDRAVARHYENAVKELKWQVFRWSSRTPSHRDRRQKAAATPSAKSSSLARAFDDRAADALRERVVVAALLANPQLVPFFEYTLDGFDFQHDDHQPLVHAILQHWQGATALTLKDDLVRTGFAATLERISTDRMVATVLGCVIGESADLGKMTVAEALARLDADRAVRREIEEGEEDIFGPATEALTYRLGQAAAARSRAGRELGDDRAEWEVGPNGARLSRDERGLFQSVLKATGIGGESLDRRAK